LPVKPSAANQPRKKRPNCESSGLADAQGFTSQRSDAYRLVVDAEPWQAEGTLQKLAFRAPRREVPLLRSGRSTTSASEERELEIGGLN
jgi:hypothetical protein